MTPLMYASESGHEAVVRLLLSHGANVAVQLCGFTVLSFTRTEASRSLLRAHGAESGDEEDKDFEGDYDHYEVEEV